MISTIQKTFSGALSSWTSTKEPRLLKRPPTDTSSQPNAPATSSRAAHMPQKRASTTPDRNTKRARGAKAAEFLSKNFSATLEEEEDPIESSPPGPRVHRMKPSSRPLTGRRQELSSRSLGQKHTESKSELKHKRLIVDLDDERSLIPRKVPLAADAFIINVPGSAQSNRSSSSTINAMPRLRPVNTLDRPIQRPGFGNPSHNLNPSHRQSSSGRSEKFTRGSKLGHSDWNAFDEPPQKRQKLDSMQIREEGATSPFFPSPRSQARTTTRSGTPISRDAQMSPTIVNSQQSSASVSEYQDVERIMRSGPISRTPSQTADHFPPKSSVNGYTEQSDEISPEEFVRSSKKEPHGDDVNLQSGMTLQDTGSASTNTIADIEAIFPATYSPNHIKFRTGISPENPKLSVTAPPTMSQPNGSCKPAPTQNSDPSGALGKGSKTRTMNTISARGKQGISSTASSDPSPIKHFLRGLVYGHLPPGPNYFTIVRGTKLEIWDSASTLSDEPVCNPPSLSKVFKILHGTDDCTKLILQFSKVEGQSATTMHLEFQSARDRDEMVSLVESANKAVLKVGKKNGDFMQRIFVHQAGIQLQSQQQRSEHTINSEPIRKERRVSGTVSPHFQNQHRIPANPVLKHPKLVDQLQSSSSISDLSGAATRTPTIITGKDRGTHSSIQKIKEIFTASKKERNSDQSEPSKISRLRSSSRKLPVTRSDLEAENFAQSRAEENMPRKKYSQEHGLGTPWTTPLIYPKIGKRRETVEHEDLLRLDEDEFLNDNLIGFFLRYLEQHLEQTDQDLAKRVYFYNSYFFERLMQTSKGRRGIDYDSVQKWTRGVDIFSRDFVIVPVNESLHWYVAIICNLSKLNIGEDNEEIENSRTPSKGVTDTSADGADQTRREGIVEDAQDQPTYQTTESLSHLSLSEHEKQVDELGPSNNSSSAISSTLPPSTPIKSGPGRRKIVRHPLKKYDTTTPIIMTLDSLGVARSPTCTALRQYIVEEAKSKRGWDIDGSLIKGMTVKGIPTQSNFSDCGLYLCAYMEKFILDPAGFVSKILQRQMDPNRDMPMMPSEDLRSRMRDMIRGLYHVQNGVDTQFPIPPVGSILLAPQNAGLPDDVHARPSQVQDDSEDELQQDQTNFITVNTTRSPVNAPTPAAAIQYSTVTPKRPPQASPSSDVAIPIAHMLAKIDGSTSTPSKSRSGTKETAITIDDDDDDAQPVFKSSPISKIPVSKNDFFDHPSELKQQATSSVKKTPSSTSKRIIESKQEISIDSYPQSPTPRARSHESTESVDTNFLQSGQSYSRMPEHHGGKTERASASRNAQDIVVMVPDSQESLLEAVQKEADLLVEEENAISIAGGDGASRIGSKNPGQESREYGHDQDQEHADQQILDGV